MTTFESLVRSAPTVNAYGDDGVWKFSQMLQGLTASVMNDHSHVDAEDVRALSATLGEDVTVHTLFDIPHDSDESCAALVLCIEGVPALLHKYVGDKMDYSDGVEMLDLGLCRRMLTACVELRVQEQWKRASADTATRDPFELLWSGVNYVTPVTSTVFSVDNPNWACCFERVFESHRAFVFQDDQMVPVTAFLRRLGEDDVVLATQAGEVTVQADNVLFELAGSTDSFEAVHEQLSRGDYWRLVDIQDYGRGRAMLRGIQHRKGHSRVTSFCLSVTDVLKGADLLTRFGTHVPGRFHLASADVDLQAIVQPEFSHIP